MFVKMKEEIISATIEALKSVQQPRFFQTERGFHGKFYCELYKELDACGILNEDIYLVRNGISEKCQT